MFAPKALHWIMGTSSAWFHSASNQESGYMHIHPHTYTHIPFSYITLIKFLFHVTTTNTVFHTEIVKHTTAVFSSVHLLYCSTQLPHSTDVCNLQSIMLMHLKTLYLPYICVVDTVHSSEKKQRALLGWRVTERQMLDIVRQKWSISQTQPQGDKREERWHCLHLRWGKLWTEEGVWRVWINW